MRNKNTLKRLLLCLTYAILGLSCKHEISDIEKVKEQLTITPSANDIQLNGDSLTANILNFSWSDARQLSDDHLVTYTTKLNLLGNNFGSSTTILNYEDEGVYSRSFTSEQLKNWANEKWGVKVNKSFTVEFRVIAQWEGGKTFEAPEVRTVSVNIAPIKTTNIEVDKVYLEGSALMGGSISLTKTLEKTNQYAFVGNLKEGDLQIPVDVEGDKYFISTNNQTLQDGSPDSISLNDNAFNWKITKAGLY